MKAVITTTARYVPERIMTNFDLEKMVKTSDEWIRTRTGIAERHVVEKGQTSSFMATKVAKILLHKSKTSPEDIDLIIIATVTPDMLFPATAALVQDNIGAHKAWGFDLSGAALIQAPRASINLSAPADSFSSRVVYSVKFFISSISLR